jgi:hypothetical protein
MKLFNAQGKVELSLDDSVTGSEVATFMDDIVMATGININTVDILLPNGTIQKSFPFEFDPIGFRNAACGYQIVQRCAEARYYRVSMLSHSPFKYTTELILENTCTAMDICRDGSMFVGIGRRKTVEVYKINTRNSFTKVCSYTPASSATKFCLIDGREMVLVLVPDDNAVHIVDHMDGGRFVRYLDTGSVKLNKPYRICTDYDKHVWIGCHGGKVVMVDL